MATVTRARQGGNWRDTDRRVRHPLHVVRRYIRRYVILEGLGLSLLFLSIAFWLGFLFDWGLFQAFGLDWIQSFQNVTMNSGIEFYFRGLILAVVVLGLCAIAVYKTTFRLFGEFSDRSMALLLERRFPRQLGDRLISAVELADPRKSERYGFSLPMTEKTIRDAAERVERVPVRQVFNWARLGRIYAAFLVVTVGLYAFVGAITCLVTWVPPTDYLLRSGDAFGIWIDRNLLLEDIHWPREAHLELLGFEPSAASKAVMRVGSGEQRPDLRVRALKWIKGDRSVPGGWSAMSWQDLETLVAQGGSAGALATLKEVMEQIRLENPWDGWVLDSDEPGGDWRSWTLDQIWRQTENKEVRARMAELHFDPNPEIAYLGARVEDYSLPLAAASNVGLAGALSGGSLFQRSSAPVSFVSIQQGVIVKGLTAGGPAEKAKFKVGDLVTAIGSTPVYDLASLRSALRASREVKSLTITVQRDGESMDLSASGLRDASGLGLALENLDKKTPVGARVTEVAKGSPAESAGFLAGDVVVEALGREITDANSLALAMQAPPATPQALFKVKRGDRTERVQVNAAAVRPDLLATADAIKIEPDGARVMSVTAGSLAGRAKLAEGDVIVKAAGRDVADQEAFLNIVRGVSLDRATNWSQDDAGKLAVEVRREGDSANVTLDVRRLPVEELFEGLSKLAAQPGMTRILSEKKIPNNVIAFWADKSFNTKQCDMISGYRYSIGLGAPQQNTVFRVRGLDYYTPYRTIVVSPPPSLSSLLVDRFEPAYVYYRIAGTDQRPLKGVKRTCLLDELPLTGISLVGKVPAGSKVVLRATLDTSEGRKLKEVSLRPVKKNDRPEGEAEDTAAVPNALAEIGKDRTSFTLTLEKVDTTHDFIMEFRDEDRAVGQRRVRIEVQPDNPPVAGLGIEEAYMRRPRMRGKNAIDLAPHAGDAWLITPNAVLPLKGKLEDDFSLIDGNYIVHLWPYNINFAEEKPEAGKEPRKPAEPPRSLRLPFSDDKPFELGLSLAQYLPSFGKWQARQTTISIDQIREYNRIDEEMMTLYRDRKYSKAIELAEALAADRQERLGDHPDVVRTLRLLAGMLDAEGKKDEAVRRLAEADLIGKRRGAEFTFGGSSDDLRLLQVVELLRDMREADERLVGQGKLKTVRNIPRLPTVQDQARLFHMMYIFLEATDNNVEAGPLTTRTRTPVKFVIVSETEFLAQVAEEEEILSKKLDDAYRSLEKSRDRLIELEEVLKQASGKSGSANYEQIGLRYTGSQRMLLDSSSLTRDVFRDYDRIEWHLRMNKSPFGAMEKKFEKVSDKIARPLRLLVQGNKDTRIDFPSVEALVKRHIDFAEDQRNRGNNGFLPTDIAAVRAQEAGEAKKQVQELMNQMNAVLIQVQELVLLSTLKSNLEEMAREQKERKEQWDRIYDQREKEELKKLGLDGLK